MIVSTYKQPEWLKKALWGFEQQTFKEFDIIIADDGSGARTKAVINEFRRTSALKIRQVWQADKGFRKTSILNKAISKTKKEYLIFTDGDCIPRNDLVERHMKLRRSNRFLSGGYFKLPESLSFNITKQDIQNQHCFDRNWLLIRGIGRSFKLNKLSKNAIKMKLLNKFTPTKATWDGNNSSCWLKDALDVNGFDERMEYGGEDREFGERLMNKGIRPIQARYGLITLHLFHRRDYVTPEMLIKNKAIRKETRKNGMIRTDHGLD